MLVFVVLALFLITGTHCSKEWTYSGELNGPDKWADLQDSFCGDNSQSPIDIKTSDVVVKEFADWKMEGYSVNKVSSITNNGHSLQLSLEEGNYTLSGGGLKGSYKAAQFHFHWGSVDSQGSEHTVDTKIYEAEMHIVHYINLYNNISEALASGDATALTVLGVFIEVRQENAALKDVFDMAKNVPFKDDVMSTTISVAEILPDDLTSFYRYSGSLTTPPCTQVVEWTVFKDPITISAEQMSVLRGLHEGKNDQSDSKEIVNNYRPVQPVNGRTVYFSSASTYNLSLLLSTIATVVALRVI